MLSPALDGNKAVFYVNTDRNFLFVGVRCLGQKFFVCYGRRSENHTVNADRKVLFRCFHSADSAAELKEKVRTFTDFFDYVKVRCCAVSCTLEVNKMNMRGALFFKFLCLSSRIVVIDRHLIIIALEKPYRFFFV